jgi:hypothetical protein
MGGHDYITQSVRQLMWHLVLGNQKFIMMTMMMMMMLMMITELLLGSSSVEKNCLHLQWENSANPVKLSDHAAHRIRRTAVKFLLAVKTEIYSAETRLFHNFRIAYTRLFPCVVLTYTS